MRVHLLLHLAVRLIPVRLHLFTGHEVGWFDVLCQRDKGDREWCGLLPWIGVGHCAFHICDVHRHRQWENNRQQSRDAPSRAVGWNEHAAWAARGGRLFGAASATS